MLVTRNPLNFLLQDHILKTVLFILSLKPWVPLPVLIISTSQQIIHWEAEFLRLDPSLNVVAYVGDKTVRRNIEMLEFYEGGSVMIEVLLSSPNAIIEVLTFQPCKSFFYFLFGS